MKNRKIHITKQNPNRQGGITMPNESKPIQREDYKAPEFQIPKIYLEFIINSHEDVTVKSTMQVEAATGNSIPFELLGENQELTAVRVNGRTLSDSEYILTDKTLTIPNVPDSFTLEIESRIDPSTNKELSGLYTSGQMLCTQCEPEGYRNITFHPDRPDVMSVFTTRIEADTEEFPFLLSNGNLLEEGELEGGRHFAVWEDPFKKPSYLFALVAGDLAEVKDSFTTMSGKEVDIRFYVEHGQESQAAHAVESLKKSMAWDEEVFGLECDLGRYMVVAVGSFTFGAMENKGLNIFNSKYVLADPATATDVDYENVLRVIAHEYFHNWTGNRVTLRDWFQLTLKEGLTVYRDQRFTEDMTSEHLKRIDDVLTLRNSQFQEDSGPNAHPVKPHEVVKINNFYTATVYRKGAEVIRMIATLIGEDGFRKGLDIYIKRHDGQAVTTDDFLAAMEDASGRDLTQFKRWYDQAGTPVCIVDSVYDKDKETLSVTISQSNPQKDGTAQEPLHIPFRIGVVGPDGEDVVSKTLELTEQSDTFVFKGIEEGSVLSLLRGFSAPVKVEYSYSDEELAFLLANDNDPFNRYEAGQRLAAKEIHALARAVEDGKSLEVKESLVAAFGKLLEDASEDPGFTAEALRLPLITAIVEDMDVCNYAAAFEARQAIRKEIGTAHEETLREMYDELDDKKPYSTDKDSIAKRSLKNTALAYLFATGKEEYVELVYSQFENADNMTDKGMALRLLSSRDNERREVTLKAFRDEWQDNPLVMDKWFSAQALSQRDGVLDDIKELQKDPVYDPKVPNRVYALLGGFQANAVKFHDESGDGYRFIADKILELDDINPSIAARFAKGFSKYGRMGETRNELMREQLQRILDADSSEQVYEIVSKTLEST